MSFAGISRRPYGGAARKFDSARIERTGTAMGLLIIKGIIRVKQVWPEGRSDADTLTVELQDAKAFTFVNSAGTRRTTHAFDNAEVVSENHRSEVIKHAANSAVRKVTIRLQGIDAPELHYQPTVPGAGGSGFIHPYRQSLGETSSNALHALLLTFGMPDIPCEVVTMVSKPGEVCDMFGRVVGNVVLHLGGARIDVNQRLLREGWALPGLYNSMSKPEIRAVLADHTAARSNKRGLFSKKIVTEKLAPFDPQRRERKGPASFTPFSDLGPVNAPKYFRRQAEHYVRTSIGQNVPANPRSFIATKPHDTAIKTNDFLKLTGSTVGKKPRPEFKQLATFLTAGYPPGPELVFWENDATLVKPGTNTEIKTW
jgi:endonuclease YncB( thermonuclease family)